MARKPITQTDHKASADAKLVEAYRALDVAQYHLYNLPGDALTAERLGAKASELRDAIATLRWELNNP